MAAFKNRKKRDVTEANAPKSRWDINLTKMAKRELIITLVSILGVTFLSIGSAFAIFTTHDESDYHVIRVGTLNIDFGEDSDNTIDLNGQYPKADSLGLSSTPYTFTIRNTGSLPANYKVSIEDDLEMIEQDNCSTQLLNKDYIKYSLDGSNVSTIGALASNHYIIDTGVLESGASKTYTIYVWITDTALNDALNKHYHGKIVVEGVNQEENEGPSIMKAYSSDLYSDYHLYKDQVTSIVTKSDILVPETAVAVTNGKGNYWDVSEAGDDSVIAYMESDGNGGYKVTIGTNGMITANADSSYLFSEFRNVKSIDLSYLDTSNVTTMYYMFNYCDKLETVNVSNFNTSKVVNMAYMFSGCSLLTTLDLKSFNTWSAEDMSYMFSDTTSLTNVMVGTDWTYTNADNSHIFDNSHISDVTYY